VKRSFKVHLFLRLLVIIFVIIGANRMIAQEFLTEQLREQIHQEMGLALSRCGASINERQAFLTCFKAHEPGSLLSNVADYYVICPESVGNSLEVRQGICQLGNQVDFWRGKESVVRGDLQFASGEVDEQSWLAVKFFGREEGSVIWIKQTDADRMVTQMWALRDRNLIRVFPIILFMVLLLNIYITRELMKPVNRIQETMSGLNASNLDRSTTLEAPYREFEKLLEVFVDLRVRLSSSFNKARRFASDASHELRTPLTILRGNAEKLIHDLPLGSDLQIRVRSMGDEVERLIDITEKLLLLSRADANGLQQNLSDVNLSELLTQLIHDAHSFQSNLKILSDIEPEVMWRCDQTLVCQLISNLYTNAVNYNLANGWLRIGLKRTSEQFELTIENPTETLPSDLTDHAFERFYRGDASHARHIDGLGLGLSICLEIAHLHQGSLSLSVTQQQTVLVCLKAPLVSC
jgi:signal transduction histidine kinase